MAELRDRKRADTRARLLEAAVSLFAEQGYDATSIDQVAAAADVSRATAFNYFPRKEDFLLEWAARRRDESRSHLAGREGVTATEAIESALTTLAASYTKDPRAKALVRCWLAAGGPLLAETGASVAMFADLVRHGQSAGELAREADAAQVARAIYNIYLGALYDWAAGDRSAVWLRRELPGAVRHLLRGLAAHS